MVTSDFAPKMSLEFVVNKILEISSEDKDKWFLDLQNQTKVLFEEFKEKDAKLKNIDFEEDLEQLDQENGLQIMGWFVLWLGKIYVKVEFLGELCIVFSKIWKVLEETQLSVQDLDNKLVWKKVTKECEGIIQQLPSFQNDQTLLYDFVQKVCQLIGKTFEIRNKS